MGGIYFHIPFCRHKCLYCNFFSVANTSQTGRVVAAMRRELAERRKDWPDNDIRTVYFGGGTPSVLPADDIADILEDVRSSFSTAQDMEVTLEANPDDVSAEKVRMWRAAGVNRVSLGVQSFDTATLAAIGRRHSLFDIECLLLISVWPGVPAGLQFILKYFASGRVLAG